MAGYEGFEHNISSLAQIVRRIIFIFWQNVTFSVLDLQSVAYAKEMASLPRYHDITRPLFTRISD